MQITNRDKEEIKALIDEAETKSTSELVPMIVKTSDVYPAAHFRGAIIVSFLFSIALYMSPFHIINPIWFIWVQVPGLLLGYALGNIPSITRLLITKKEVEYEVTQRAIEAFFENSLHTTENHNGVLIFISLLERKIKIITDVNVRAKIEQKIWDEIIGDFTEKVGQGKFLDALKESISATSSVLERHFPSNGARKNELKNELIIEP